MGAERVHISIVVVGHVNSGKSTTVGHLIHMLGGIEEHAIQRIEEQAAEMNRASFKYAWVLDKLKAERERGFTMEISLGKLQTPNYLLSVIDAPGHRDFIHHMIAGTSMADCALLMIDARPGAFEEGISLNGHGQTREHALLARTFGIRQIICCCNKMDATAPMYSPDRYDEIVKKTSSLLAKVGFRNEQYTFIPMSGFRGDNLVEMSPSLGWFQGPTLLQALDQLSVPVRPLKKHPLRLPIECVRMVDGIGIVAVGRVQSGSLKPGMSVNFAPYDVTQELTAEVKSVQRHKYHEATREALPGDIVGFNVSGIPWKMLQRGFVASNSVDDRAWEASSFTAIVSVVDHPGQISNGYTATLHCHTSHVPVTFAEIIRTVVMESANVMRTVEKNPLFLKQKDVAEVRMVPSNPVVLESYSEYPPLGRFAVRDVDLNNTVAVGIVRSVEKILPTRQQKLEMELAEVDAKIEGLAVKILRVKRDLKKSEGLLQGNEMKTEVHSHLLGLAGDRKVKESSEFKHCKQRMQDDLLRHKLKLDSSFSRKVDSKKVDDLRQSLQSLEKELKDLEERKGVIKRELKVAKRTKS